MSAGPLRDDELHALADGALEPARAAELEAALAQRPEAAARVAFYRRLNRELRALHALPLDEAPPPLPARPRAGRRLAAAVAAALALGVFAGWHAREAQVPRQPAPRAAAPAVAQQAAQAHAAFVVEVRHPVEVVAAEEAHLVRWLSNRLGANVTAPRLDAAGFALMGGRLLPAAGGGVAAQFMYEDKAGRRVTLYLKRPEPGMRGAAFEFAAAADGVGVFWWSDERFAYALTGALPRADLLPLARAAFEQLDR